MCYQKEFKSALQRQELDVIAGCDVVF